MQPGMTATFVNFCPEFRQDPLEFRVGGVGSPIWWSDYAIDNPDF